MDPRNRIDLMLSGAMDESGARMRAMRFDDAEPASLGYAVAAHAPETEGADAARVRQLRSRDICRCTCIGMVETILDPRTARARNEVGR
jgi:hypothetical protein